MSESSKGAGSRGGAPDDPAATPPDRRGGNAGTSGSSGTPKPGRISIAAADPDVIAEVRGFTLFLASTRGRDGLRTIGSLFDAALMGKGNLPAWREKYNDGAPFPLVRDSTIDDDDPKQGRISISGVNSEILNEARGLVMHLTVHGSRDNLRTIGDVVTAAFQGEGNLPTWRKRFNKGRKFPPAEALPPGRK